MKKYITLAALLAAGTACMHAGVTGSDAQSLLSEIVATEYTQGEAYTLTFTIEDFGGINDSAKEILSLSSGYYLIAQLNGGNSAQRYFGLSNEKDDAPAPADFTFSKDGDVKTLTSTEGALPLSWITRNDDGSASAWRQLTDSSGNYEVTIQIASDGTDSSLTLTYGGANSTTDKVLFVGTDIVLSGITPSAGFGSAELSSASLVLDGKTYVIPEPSAFGMLAGLGALALVASRRRRK